jgi:multidrug resistance efflux pump
LEDIKAKEELRLKLIEAEAALKEVEEEYDLYLRQLDNYRIIIKKEKEKILQIKQEWGCTSVKN